MKIVLRKGCLIAIALSIDSGTRALRDRVENPPLQIAWDMSPGNGDYLGGPGKSAAPCEFDMSVDYNY